MTNEEEQKINKFIDAVVEGLYKNESLVTKKNLSKAWKIDFFELEGYKFDRWLDSVEIIVSREN